MEVSCGGNVSGVLTSNRFGGTDAAERKAYHRDLKKLESGDLEMNSIGLSMAHLSKDLERAAAEAAAGSSGGGGGGGGGDGRPQSDKSAAEQLGALLESNDFDAEDAGRAGTAAVEQEKGNWMYMAQKRRASIVTPRNGAPAYVIPPPPLIGDKNQPMPPPPPPKQG